VYAVVSNVLGAGLKLGVEWLWSLSTTLTALMVAVRASSAMTWWIVVVTADWCGCRRGVPFA
jgi:hypothetical protein